MLIVQSFIARCFEKFSQQTTRTVGGLLCISDALYLSRVYKKDVKSADKIARVVDGHYKTILHAALTHNVRRVKQEINNWDLFIKTNQRYLHEIGEEYEAFVREKRGTTSIEFGQRMPKFSFAIQVD